MTTHVISIKSNPKLTSLFDKFIELDHSHEDSVHRSIQCFLSNSSLFEDKSTDLRINDSEELELNVLLDNGDYFEVELPSLDLIDLCTIIDQVNEVYPKSLNLYELKRNLIK